MSSFLRQTCARMIIPTQQAVSHYLQSVLSSKRTCKKKPLALVSPLGQRKEEVAEEEEEE